MNLEEAKSLAARLRKIPNVQVLGVKSYKDGKALVLSINRRGKVRVADDDRAVFKVARAAKVHGQRWEVLGVCSNCGRELRAADGHYHSVRVLGGYAEAICCRCVERTSGNKCQVSVPRTESAKRLCYILSQSGHKCERAANHKGRHAMRKGDDIIRWG